MASVHMSMLNKKQQATLIKRNEIYLKEGKLNGLNKRIHETDTLFSYVNRCARCDQLKLVKHGLRPLKHFNYHYSTSTGCSKHCTYCINSGLNATDALVAKQLMEMNGIISLEGKLKIRDVSGLWLNADVYQNPAKALLDSVDHFDKVTQREYEKEKAHLSLGLIAGSLLSILLLTVLFTSG